LEGGDWVVVQGTTEWTHIIDTRVLERGLHSLEVRAFDGFTYSTVAHAMLRINQPPVLHITTPADGAVIVSTTRAEGMVYDDDGDTPVVELRLDGGPWTTIEDTNTWSMDLVPSILGTGPHLLEARAFDGIHHSAAVSVNFTVDLPPSVVITHPRDGIRIATPIIVSGRAVDDFGVEMVSVRVDGGEWKKVEGTVEWSLTLDLESGEHVVEAISFDGLSESDVSGITFFVDERPVVEILHPRSGEVMGRKVVVEVTVQDDLDNVTTVQVRVDGGEWQDIEHDGGWSLQLELGEGEHVVEARCSDGFHLSDIESVEFSVESKDVAGSEWYAIALIIVIIACLVIVYYWFRSR
jgi:hypothetical protein